MDNHSNIVFKEAIPLILEVTSLTFLIKFVTTYSFRLYFIKMRYLESWSK
jgi:hypothetical protein